MKKVFHLFVSLCIVVLISLTVACNKDEVSVAPEITLNKNELILEIGKSERLLASFNPVDAPNQAHTWNSTKPQIASVDDTGNVTGVEKGEAMISAKALDGGKVATCKVTIVDKIVLPTGMKLNKENVNLIEGEKFSLEVTVLPDNATDKQYTFQSKDEKIASVDKSGVITAQSPGNTEIEVKSTSGNLKKTCKVSVHEKGIEFSNVEADDITDSSAMIGGTYVAYGVDVQEIGICYSIKSNPTVGDNKIKSTEKGRISCLIEDLVSETNYYARAYAIFDNKTVYGNEISFMTTASLITNFKPIEVYDDMLILTSEAINGIDKINVCYSQSPNPKVTDEVAIASNDSTHQLRLTLKALKPNTTYYLRSYHESNEGFIYHDDEVAVSTIGDSNIKISNYSIENPIEKYSIEYTGNYCVEYSINFSTELDGEFLITTDSEKVFMTKESTLSSSNKVKELYFSNDVRLRLQIGGGSKIDVGSFAHCRWGKDVNIYIKHIQSGVTYIHKLNMYNRYFMCWEIIRGEVCLYFLQRWDK